MKKNSAISENPFFGQTYFFKPQNKPPLEIGVLLSRRGDYFVGFIGSRGTAVTFKHLELEPSTLGIIVQRRLDLWAADKFLNPVPGRKFKNSDSVVLTRVQTFLILDILRKTQKDLDMLVGVANALLSRVSKAASGVRKAVALVQVSFDFKKENANDEKSH